MLTQEVFSVDFNEIHSGKANRIAKKNIAFEERHKKGDILNLKSSRIRRTSYLLNLVMKIIVKISPLTKKKPGKSRLCRTFPEFFMNGWENGKMLNGVKRPNRSERAFLCTEELFAAGDEEETATDEHFKRTGDRYAPTGNGFGIDRTCMLLTNLQLSEMSCLPTMKSLDAKKGEGRLKRQRKCCGQRKRPQKRLISPT